MTAETLLESVCQRQRQEADAVHWYAMSATYRNELKLQSLLAEAGVETYVAMTTEVIDVNGRRIKKRVPAVSNLIFVHSSSTCIQELKRGLPHLQYKVRQMNGRAEKIIVNDSDMATFMRISQLLDNVRYLPTDSPEIAQGTRVRITGGSFEGLEGVMLKTARARSASFVVAIEDTIAAAIKIPRELVEPLA